ncbi:hypothetical protein B0J17DRAFT_724026 [Rhizoctonia solani]|nr:hypothetical protein B0J17DRAFT_724026 [Rhizoctonia solani]
MSHLPRAHPIWGRPIDEYTASYDLAAVQNRKAVTRKMEAEGAQAIQRISRMAKQVNYTTLHAEEVKMQTLESFLQLTLSPRTFHHFAHAPLVSGCVRFMSSVKPEGHRSSPFSYEFGYLCFKILTIAIGACILQWTNELDNTTSRMFSEANTGLLLVFSDSVARAVNAKIQMATLGGQCDWVLDWVEEMGSRQGALVLQSDVNTILSLLWDDQELLIKAFAATYTPGPSGVLFLFWRHLHFARSARDGVFESQPPSKLAVPFCEILWRYMLVFTRDQGDTLILLHRHLKMTNAADVWDSSPKTVVLNDLKSLIQVYCDLLAMSDIEPYPALNIGILPILLNFLCHLAGARPSAEGSYPLLVERTLERVCDTLTQETERNDFETRFRHAQTMFSFLAVLLEHVKNAQTYTRDQAGQRAVLSILKALKQLGILDLIGKMSLMFEPASDGMVDSTHLTAFMMQVVLGLIRNISIIAPSHIMDSAFGYYVPDWIKFNEHLAYRIQHHTTSYPPPVHVALSYRMWNEIAETLGIYNQRSEAEP